MTTLGRNLRRIAVGLACIALLLVSRTRAGRTTELELTSFLQLLDADGDDKLGAYEGAEALLALVTEADTDADRALSRAELDDFFDDELTADLAEREDEFGLIEEVRLDVLEFLAEVDTDKDGSFALSDLPEEEREGFASQFGLFDANADGVVTRAELLFFVEAEFRHAAFACTGTEAHMRGVIAATTPGRVLELCLEHPEVDTIVMDDVPGSMDDFANLRAARMVRRLGLRTHVPADGTVSSGGTDFFLAGSVRTAASGAKFGVHSWSSGETEGADVPRDSEEHRLYLDYYAEMEVPAAFYWFTLEAAPAMGNHWMTAAEIERFGMLTSR